MQPEGGGEGENLPTVNPSPTAGARVAHAHPVFPGKRTVSLQLCQDDASYSVVKLNRQMSSQSDARLRRAAPRRSDVLNEEPACGGIVG